MNYSELQSLNEAVSSIRDGKDLTEARRDPYKVVARIYNGEYNDRIKEFINHIDNEMHMAMGHSEDLEDAQSKEQDLHLVDEYPDAVNDAHDQFLKKLRKALLSIRISM